MSVWQVRDKLYLDIAYTATEARGQDTGLAVFPHFSLFAVSRAHYFNDAINLTSKSHCLRPPPHHHPHPLGSAVPQGAGGLSHWPADGPGWAPVQAFIALRVHLF